MNTCKVSSVIDRSLRGIAGLFLILATGLFFGHSENWIWFILFIGFNLLQSSFTCWCPMMTILRRVFK